MNLNEFIESLTDSQLYFLINYTTVPGEILEYDLLADLQMLCLKELKVRAIAQKMMLDMTSNDNVFDVEVS